MYKIVAHPGSAHKDDFMAVSVLLATLGNAEVFRREATSEDMADLNTYVVDVGMEHSPERHNFDHHQDQSLPCAFHQLQPGYRARLDGCPFDGAHLCSTQQFGHGISPEVFKLHIF